MGVWKTWSFASATLVSVLVAHLLPGLPSPAQADELGDKAQQSIVYVFYDLPGSQLVGGRHIQGTGFIISNKGFLLTASHLFEDWLKVYKTKDDQDAHPIQGTVGGKPGSVGQAVLTLTRVHLGDPQNEDVALLKLPDKPAGEEYPWAPVCLSNPSPSLNDSLVAFGFPLDQDFQPDPVRLGTMNAPGARWAAKSPFTFGMSGGPVYWQGNVVGVVEGGLSAPDGTLPEEAKWITPIRRAHPLLGEVEGFVEASASQDTVDSILQRPNQSTCRYLG
jgi:hypothetical protein